MKVLFISGSVRTRDDFGRLIPFEKSPHFEHLFTMFGDELIYPPVYWYEGNYLFPFMEEIVEKEKPDVIIGYSAGGHLGFHLCNKYKIKGIHFNPAIARTSEAPTLQILPEDYKNIPINYDQVIVIGEEDRKFRGGVDGHLVHTYLQSIGFDKKGEIILIPDLGHSVPLGIFKMVFEYFRDIWKS
jgi:hypothetical protein